jgi:hypothetical protein
MELPGDENRLLPLFAAAIRGLSLRKENTNLLKRP